MYRSLGGIAPASSGYATVTIAPKISKTLDPVSANASVATVRGVVSSSWTRHTAARCVDGLASLVTMRVSVPVGMLGDVHVPERARRVGHQARYGREQFNLACVPRWER